MQHNTIQEERCRICGGAVIRRGPGRWAVYHAERPLGTVQSIPPHFAAVS